MYNLITRLIFLPKHIKKIILILGDAIFFIASVIFSFYSLYGHALYQYKISLSYIAFSTLVFILIFNFFGLYNIIIRYSNLIDFDKWIKSFVCYFFILLISVTLHKTELKISFIIYQTVIAFLFLMSFRVFSFKLLKVYSAKNNKKSDLDCILIYGAGQAGREILGVLQQNSNNHIVGFVDDNKDIQGRSQNNLNIYSPNEISNLIVKNGVTRIILAIPSIKKQRKNEIINSQLIHNIPVSTLPNLNKIISKQYNSTDILNLKIEDLLGREPIIADKKLLSKNITGKIVLVTGAGGSIGSELSRQIIKLMPKKLILLDHSEFSLFSIFSELKLKNPNITKKNNIVPIIGNINFKHEVDRIIENERPFTIYHAAAYKHVGIVEKNILSGIRNNIFGTLNVIKSSINNNVKNFIFISTDKAVRPTNIMGASKRVGELILQALANKNNNIKISIVRFGNVLGSSGSVVPIFKNQIKMGGPVTVSHEEVERYFMTIPEATELVIQASSLSQESGSIFYLDMGEPVKIIDLAKKMINLSGHVVVTDNREVLNGIKIVFTGLNVGEKMFEELIIDGISTATDHPRIFSVKEKFLEWSVLNEIVKKIEIDMKNFSEANILASLKQIVTGFKNTKYTIKK
jgi:FlaA1/EpsC-like NDP-sugar epimerase